ncbi:hypothetical protein N2152v2_009099 [Parachlorella kessleri]
MTSPPPTFNAIVQEYHRSHELFRVTLEQLAQQLAQLEVSQQAKDNVGVDVLQRIAAKDTKGNFNGTTASSSELVQLDDLLLKAAVAEGARREADLVTRMASAVALDTRPAQLSSFTTILKCQPFLIGAKLGSMEAPE